VFHPQFFKNKKYLTSVMTSKRKKGNNPLPAILQQAQKNSLVVSLN